MADIDQLFATFRAEAGTEIRPPGSDVARRTVRRRRSVRLAATALAVVAVVAVGLLARSGPGGPAVIGDPPATGPALGLDQRDQLGVEALATLGYAPADAPSSPALRPIRPGIIFGGIGALTEFTYRLGTPAEPLPPGLYTVQAVCVGLGSVKVERRSRPDPAASMEVECGDGAMEASVIIYAHGQLDLTIIPNDEAIGRAGVAVVLTDPRVVAARNALGVPSTPLRSGGETVLYEPTMNVYESGFEAGRYLLLVACAGRGTIDVTFEAGTTRVSQTVVCTRAGVPTGLTLTSATAGESMTVAIVPDEVATDQAAVVYRVTKA